MGDEPGVDLLPRGGHGPLPIRPGLQGGIRQEPAAPDLSGPLAHDVAQLVAQPLLAGPGGEVGHTGGKGDLIPLGDGLRSGFPHRLALI